MRVWRRGSAHGVARSSDILPTVQALGYNLLEPNPDGLRPLFIKDRLYSYANILGVPEEKIATLEQIYQHHQS